MLRNAGCNSSETISTQLAYYIKRFFPEEKEASIEAFYAHHCAPLTVKYIPLDEDALVNYSINIFDKNLKIYRQALEGFTTLKLEQNDLQYAVKMDENSLNIYRNLSALTYDELQNLYSLEMPIIEYLLRLNEIVLQDIANELNSASHNIEDDPISSSRIHVPTKSFHNIQRLIQNIWIQQEIEAIEKKIDSYTLSFGEQSRSFGSPVHAERNDELSVEIQTNEIIENHSVIDFKV